MGFGGFGWGTAQGVMTEQFVKIKCAWHMTMTTLRGHKRVVCSGYQVKELGPVYVTLEFIDEMFRGYTIAVPRRLEATLRTVAPEIVGATATRAGSWQARVAITERNCLPSSVCLEVATY
jgi:hypothetical protein